jgi:hypothetical protein
MPDELLTIEDAAKKLPAIKTQPGQWRISPKALQGYVEKGPF